MKVYGDPASTCTRKVLATLAEKGQSAEFVHVALGKGEHKSPAHLVRQPFGQVPVLEEDDGWLLYESRAIIRHLDRTLPGPKLTPGDARGAARMEQWISVETSNFTPAAMKIIYQAVFAKWAGQEPKHENIEAGRAQLAWPLEVLDQQLGRTPWLVGDQFTLADLTYLPYLEYLDLGGEGHLAASHPNVARWWATARARPAWQMAIGKQLATAG